MNREEVKRLLRYETDEYDKYIDVILPKLIDFTLSYCNRREVTEGMKIPISKLIEHNINVAGVKTNSGKGLTTQYSMATPEYIIQLLAPYVVSERAVIFK